MCPLGNVETLLYVDACFDEAFDLFAEGYRIQDYPIADDALSTLVKDARWNQVKNFALTIKNNCVTRVGATLKSCYNIVVRSKDIDDLAFCLRHPIGGLIIRLWAWNRISELAGVQALCLILKGC